jgi:hypothetical protein
MNQTPRHPASRSGQSFFGLLSVLALLALACFVPMAQADNAGIEYRDAPPSATGEIPTTHSDPQAKASKKSGGAQTPEDSAESNGSDSEPSEGDSQAGGVTGSNDGGTGHGSTGKAQGNPGKGSASSPGTDAKSVANPPASSDSGGSSPLVPILIAIGLVMAAAIAAVVIRQRRQRDGSDGHVSPEAS